MASPSRSSGTNTYFSPSVTPGYVSAEEDYFSDATEGMRDEDSNEAPSTPVRAPLHLEDEDDLPTPTKLSPIVTKFKSAEESHARMSENDGEITAYKDDDSVRLPKEDVIGTAPISLEASLDAKEAIGVKGATSDSGRDASDASSSVQQGVRNGGLDIGMEDKAVEGTEKNKQQVFGSFEERTEGYEPKDGLSGGNDFSESEETKGEQNSFGDDFGDDFDEFGETIEMDVGFDDFEGFQDGTTSEFDAPEFTESQVSTPPPPPPPPAVPVLPVPVMDFDSFKNSEETHNTMCEIVGKLYSTDDFEPPKKTLSRTRTGVFLTERSESLWNQLVAPPPLQPPDWKRSRIRRLFLVSLGIPVDLDEILPTSKQKKLVLPSTKALPAHLSTSSAPSSRRSSTDSASGVSRRNRSKSRNRAATSSRAQSSHRSSKVDKNPPMPDFDEPAARILCTTSDLVLEGMREKELRGHIKTLQDLTNTASELLTWWLKKRDGATGDKETFETVIESLVGYARKTRQGAR